VFEFDRRPKEEPHATTGGERLFLFGFCALFVLGMFGEVFHEFSPNRLSFFFFLLFWCVLTIAHEAGHALVANFLGWRVDEVRLGFGPVLGRYNVMGLPVEMRAFPIVGLVQVVPQSLEYAKFKNMLIYAAGPGVELGLAWLVGAGIGWDVVFLPNDSLPVIAGQSLMVAAVLGAGLNLFPFSPQPGVITDGLGIILSPFWSRADYEALMVRPVLVEGERLIEEGELEEAQTLFERAVEVRPDIILLHLGLGRVCVKQGRTEDGLLMMQALLLASSVKRKPDVREALENLRRYIEQVAW